MKKTILITLTLLGVLGTSYAQELKFGIKAGANFSHLKADNKWFNADTKAGYLAGLWGRVGIGSFHIQPEAYLTSKSAKVHPNAENEALDFTKGDVKFTNIDVPILLGKKFSLGLVSAKLQAGPLFSFVLKEKSPYSQSAEEVVKGTFDNYKKNFASVVFGTGVDVLSLSVDLRYELGLNNISKYDGPKQKMNLWTVSVGYSLF